MSIIVPLKETSKSTPMKRYYALDVHKDSVFMFIIEDFDFIKKFTHSVTCKMTMRMSITYQIFVCSIKALVFAGAMNIRHFLPDIFCHLIGRNIFLIRLQSSLCLDTLFILKHGIANASLMLAFIFWFGLFMFPDQKTFSSG